MSAHLTEFIPWVSFIAGLSGSLHCVSMCGGLVTASCQKSRDVLRYQAGRLVGYLFLGTVAGTIGGWLNISAMTEFSFFSGIIIGILFIYWGIQNFRGKKAELPVPKFFGKIYGKLWFRLVHKNNSFSRSFFTGLISIILPCGLLYGIVIGTIALESRWLALTSMFFFWLGTLPVMIVAPEIVQKILKPFKAKLPKTYAVTLLTIGVLTISLRVAKLQHTETNERFSGEITQKSCH